MSDECRVLLRKYWDQTNIPGTPGRMNGWSNFKKKNRKKTLEELQSMFANPVCTVNWATIGSLGSCTPAITRCNSATISEDMETTMNTVDTNLGARLAIMRAISSVGYKHDELAMKKFGFEEKRKPKDAAELIAWIKADDYIAPDTKDEDYSPWDYSYDKFLGITFPPKVKKDWEGLEKARTEFQKERSALELEVQVLEPTEALKNFKKFESKYIH